MVLMKKTITILLLLFICICSFGQKKDELPKQDTATYLLIGKMPDFKLLYMAVKTPRDITPNQSDAILKWIETVRAIKPDTTTKVKK